MRLWGVTPFLAAALLGGAGTHQAPVHDAVRTSAAYRAVHQGPALRSAGGSASVARKGTKSNAATTPPSLATATAVLNRISPGEWQTTVLVDGAGTRCPGPARYWLETTALNGTFRAASAASAGARQQGSPVLCDITLTFTGPAQIPATATLVLAEGATPSSAVLTVVRVVSLSEYLLIPIAVGAGMVLLLLLSVLQFVKSYGRKGDQLSPFGSAFWKSSISASGAWTVGDSWATNIVAIVAVLGTILGITSAANSLFPGVGLDRFVILNTIAGGIAAAAPLVFGVLYARWTAKNPGLTVDAQVRQPVTACLAGTCSATLQPGISLTLPGNEVRRLRHRAEVILKKGAPVRPASPGLFRLAGEPEATLPKGSLITLPKGARIRLPGGEQRALADAVSAQLGADAQVVLGRHPSVTPLDRMAAALPSGTLAVKVTKDTEIALPEFPAAQVMAGATVSLAAAAVAAFRADPVLALADQKITFPGETLVSFSQTTPDVLAGTLVAVPAAARATLGKDATATLPGIKPGPRPKVTAQAGAAIIAAGGAVIETIKSPARPDAADDPGQQSAQVEAGHTVQVPPGSEFAIHALGPIGLPGGSDIVVTGSCIIEIIEISEISEAGEAGEAGGALIVAGSDIAPLPHALQPDKAPPQDDVTLRLPVRMTAHVSAKITPADAANFALSAQSTVRSPRRAPFTLPADLHIELPQSSSMLVANMCLVMISAVVTIFGIGAEIGIAGVLAVDLSDANAAGRWIAFIACVIIGLFVLYYSTTAIRTLADPQPGSSISARPGTSFTL